jgi:hypothetical protein
MPRRMTVLLTAGAVVAAASLVPSAPAAPNRVVASATGSGHAIRSGELRTFSFTARRYADGTSEGQLQLNSRSFDVVIHIRIDCLRLDGNIAIMSGRITRVSDPTQGSVGELNRLRVQDNGEGAGAPPDRISGIPENTTNDPTTCEGDNSDRLLDRVVERGNIQVRGG